MMTTMVLVLVLLVFAGHAHGQCTGAVRTDGQCGPLVAGAACRIGQCCSAFGWCGTTAAHCSAPLCPAATSPTSCTGAVRVDGQCGPRVGNAACAVGSCCSSFGWCGTTAAYCTADICSAQTPTPTSSPISSPTSSPTSSPSCSGPVRGDGRCGPSFANAACSVGLCCSSFGWCGTGAAFCTTPPPLCPAATTPTPTLAPSSCTGAVRVDGRCGPSYGNAMCAVGNCCSAFAWCGTTTSHCNAQSLCSFSSATPAPTPSGITRCSGAVRTDGQCGSGFGNAGCSTGSCCSQAGRCGTGSAFCGTTAQCSSSVPISFGDVSSFNWCGPTRSIALTFDDTLFREPAITDLLADLARLNIPATFFLTAANYPSCYNIQRVLSAGHSIQDHSMNHRDSTTLTSAEFQYEVVSVPIWVRTQCGIAIPMNQFRPPLGRFTHALAQQVNLLGYTVTSWTIDTHDSEGYTLAQAESAVATQFANLPTGSSAIIIAHDYLYTTSGTKGIIDYYVGLFTGYTFVTIDQCFQQCLALGSCNAPPNYGPGLWAA